jgi:hypothetical protein
MITVESTPGDGTTFCITLPVEASGTTRPVVADRALAGAAS